MAGCLAEHSPDWNVTGLIQNIAISRETPLSERLNHGHGSRCSTLERLCALTRPVKCAQLCLGGKKEL